MPSTFIPLSGEDPMGTMKKLPAMARSFVRGLQETSASHPTRDPIPKNKTPKPRLSNLQFPPIHTIHTIHPLRSHDPT
jgi:hypothetical protein